MAAPLFLQLKGYCAGAIQSCVEKLDFYENIEIYVPGAGAENN